MPRPHDARDRRPSRIFSCAPVLILSLLVVAAVARWPTFFGPATAAQKPAPTSDQDDVLRVRTDLITVPTRVLDKRGQRVGGLTRDDFTLQVDGRPTQLDHFSAGTDRVAMAFLLDASGSAREYLAQQRDAALALFARFGSGSQISVIRFGEKIQVAVPFTNDSDQARRGFDFGARSGNHSAIFDSAAAALKLFEQRKKDALERRIIILTSDGLDNASTSSAARVVERARADDVSFYLIHFPLFAPNGEHLGIRPPAKGFRDLADKTGGRYFVAGDVKQALNPDATYDLSPIFLAIADDLAGQYLLGFYPDEASRDGRHHAIDVRLRHDSGGRVVKTLRDGYS